MLRGLRRVIDYILSIFKVSCPLLLALFLPRLFLYYVEKPNTIQSVHAQHIDFIVGLENLSDTVIRKEMDRRELVSPEELQETLSKDLTKFYVKTIDSCVYRSLLQMVQV